MPGPISDSFDAEWGSGANRDEIGEELRRVYDTVSSLLNHSPPLFVLDLIHTDMPRAIVATLTEKDWRLIRFALERAGESL